MEAATNHPASRELDRRRRKILAFALALGLPASMLAYYNALHLPAATGFDAAVTLVMAVGIAACLLWLWRHPGLSEWIGLAFTLVIGIGFTLRLAGAFIGAQAAQLPLDAISLPFLTWLPLLFVLAFVLLRARLAFWLSFGFYLAMAGIVLAYAVPRLSAGADEAQLIALFQQFVLGHAIYIALLSIIPALRRQHGQSAAEIETLRAQSEVADMQRRLAAIYTSSPDALVATDVKGRVFAWNPAAQALFGYTAEEMIGRTVRILRPPGSEAEGKTFEERLRAGESVRDLETVRIAKDGRHVPVSLTVSPHADADGNPVGVAAFYHDISEEREIRQQLKISEQQFRTAFETAPIGMALVSPEGRWLDVNQRLCEIVGYDHDELLEMEFQTITHPEDLEANLDLMQRLQAGEIDSCRTEKRYYHKDGAVVWVVLAVSLVRDAEGEPLYFVSQIEDITEAKRARLELVRSNAELEQFAYITSHDLREPLRGIAGFAKLLRKRYDRVLDEAGQEYLQLIDEGVHRANALISDLFEYARVGSLKDSTRVDSNAVLDSVLDMLRHRLDDRGARVERDDLPPVLAQYSDMRLVLQNLIGNALKFVPPERTPVIEIRARMADGMVEFSVADNGPGIPPERGENVFLIFHRLHGREIEGTGIGLAICRKAIERYGGHIWVDPNPGAGASFHFTLPPARPSSGNLQAV